MARISELTDRGIRYRGGFRGKRIAITDLIDSRARFNLVDFRIDDSRVRDCATYCIMQIEMAGHYYVTWHSSSILSEFLTEVKAQSPDYFPITDCMLYEGDDRGYYLKDADDSAVTLSESEVERMMRNVGRRR